MDCHPQSHDKAHEPIALREAPVRSPSVTGDCQLAVRLSPGTVSPQSVCHRGLSPGTVSPQSVCYRGLSPGTVSPQSVCYRGLSPGTVSPQSVCYRGLSPGTVSPQSVCHRGLSAHSPSVTGGLSARSPSVTGDCHRGLSAYSPSVTGDCQPTVRLSPGDCHHSPSVTGDCQSTVRLSPGDMVGSSTRSTMLPTCSAGQSSNMAKIFRTHRAGEMIPEMGGLGPGGPRGKGSSSVSKGPKPPMQLLQLLKNSPREVKRAHFRYIGIGPPGSHPGSEINGARSGRSLPVPPPPVSPAIRTHAAKIQMT